MYLVFMGKTLHIYMEDMFYIYVEMVFVPWY